MLSQKSYIDRNGRLFIPAKIRKTLNLKPSDEVSLKYSDTELVVSTFQSNLEKARSMLDKYKDKDILNEFKSLRQEDAKKE
jgi:AbrB family looped-hinge helix DNA binding protein